MSKIWNISEIYSTLGFTEFDTLEKYRKSFNKSELGSLHSVFLFECMAKEAGLSELYWGRKNIFGPFAKIGLMVLKAYIVFSDRQLVEHLNGNIYYQLFCGVMIDPSRPITGSKIVSTIRNESIPSWHGRFPKGPRLTLEALPWEHSRVYLMSPVMKTTYVFYRHEAPLVQYRIALQAYLSTLPGSWRKVSAQQIYGCCKILSVLL